LTTYNTSNSELVNNSGQAIAIDSDGSFWFGTSGGGISELSGGNWVTYDTLNSGLTNNYVSAIAIDASGNK
jgi:ligand-binding sensor domain-containing protein